MEIHGDAWRCMALHGNVLEMRSIETHGERAWDHPHRMYQVEMRSY